jgi:hypothetical protein
MRVLLLLAALASPPSPFQPVNAPPQTVQDVRKEAPTGVPANKNIHDNRIQVRPSSKRPSSEGRAGPGIG